MGAIKRVLENIAELAVEKVDHWISVESNEFYEMDADEKLGLIEDRLSDFFEQYGDSIAEGEGVSGDEFREFVGDHFSHIANLVTNQLS